MTNRNLEMAEKDGTVSITFDWTIGTQQGKFIFELTKENSLSYGFAPSVPPPPAHVSRKLIPFPGTEDLNGKC